MYLYIIYSLLICSTFVCPFVVISDNGFLLKPVSGSKYKNIDIINTFDIKFLMGNIHLHDILL